MNIPNYHIQEKIYESTHSVVYRGIRQGDLLPVVLKVLREDFPTSEDLARLKQEYELTRRLSNVSGVLNVYSLEKYQNTLVMCLEDFEGKPLKTWIENHALTLEEKLLLAIEAIKILGSIHQRNVIHKDINPGNLIFNQQTNVLKVIDLGIATKLSQQHVTLRNPNGLEGTLAYMSPEQTGRMNRKLDYRTDYYSLGATLYELFTGVVPFTAGDAMEVVHCHIAKQPPLPHKINPDLPEPIANIIMKLLEKTAEDRYQSAWGMQADFEYCLQQWRQHQSIANFDIAQKDIADRFHITEKLYGRAQEINDLLATFERVANTSGKTEVVLVTGYSGVGKSVLVHEAFKLLTGKNGYFIAGKFDQVQRNIPYNAIVSAFGELVQQLLTENQDTLHHWQEKLQANLGQNAQVIIDVIPEVEWIIGPQPDVPELGPAELQNRFSTVFQNFIRVFCQPKHPLVLFLDDLQWVDSATLKLLEVITDWDNTALMLIGAYRDNEVDDNHPLMMTLAQLREDDIGIHERVLKPLPAEHIRHLIADSLQQDNNAVTALTELVIRKTGGNPFFVNQFLLTLYQENLLRYFPAKDDRESGWRWSIEQIEAKNITDNVVDLMLNKLKKLPESAQQTLRLAACVGNHFDLNTLAIIYEASPEQTLEALLPPLTEGLILSTCELDASDATQHFRFLHERVQQAAYTLIDEEQKKAVHLKIGRLLLRNATAESIEHHLFDIVNHINVGITLIEDETERNTLAELNWQAGKKAKAANAYLAAEEYLIASMAFIQDSCWKARYTVTRAIYKAGAEVAYLNGRFENSDVLIDSLITHAQDPSDKADIYNLRIVQYTLLGRYAEAIETSQLALKELDALLPSEDFEAALKHEIKAIEDNLGNRAIATLESAPAMTDVNKQAVIQVLGTMMPLTYFSHQEMFKLIVAKTVNCSIQYGLVKSASSVYAAYGSILIAHLEDYFSGYQYGLLAMRLSNRFNDLAQKCKTNMTFANQISPWVKHLRESEEVNRKGYQAGMASGELQYCGYILHQQLQNECYQGARIESILNKLPGFLRFCQKTQNLIATDAMHSAQLCLRNLSGQTSGRLDFSNSEFDSAEAFLNSCDKHHSLYVIGSFHTDKAEILYLYGYYDAALIALTEAQAQLPYMLGHLSLTKHNFYLSLTLLALYPEASAQTQADYWLRIEDNQRQMETWVDNCPENCLHKYCLVNAEIARVRDNPEKAMDWYDEAIVSAKEHDFIQNEAIGNELAGRFWLTRGKSKIARIYIQEAHYGYQQWGAKHKIADMETQYPQCLLWQKPASALPEATILSTTQNKHDWLDFKSVVKASQVLSGEIALTKLLNKMMQLVIENAGAEKGLLLLPEQERWLVQASGHADRGNVAVLQGVPAEASDQLSINILQYVVRTQDNVVLHDALQSGDFARDPYVIQYEPKSLLCMPLLNQGKLTGILYLENNLTAGAFTAERLEMLTLLSSQLAISIENACLYDSLEQKVTERTQALSDALEHLKITQGQLVEAEKMASLGSLVAGVAHEINTPIGIGLMSSSALKRRTDNIITALTQNKLKKSALSRYFDDVSEGNDAIIRNLERAAELVKSFKQVSVDQSSSEKRVFCIKPYIDDILISLKPQIKETAHSICAQGDAEIEIHSYPGALSQIITNLVMNSLTHAYQAGEQGHLSLDIKRADDSIIITYEDDGRGIPEAAQQKIFDPFFTTNRAQGNTGLGLHITYNLVTQKLQGTIQVDSIQDKGTKFIITLPKDLA